ncbi:MAG: hypothetical protein K6D03_10185 [Solobacterium sp.]|nr:hypothetical protein [Solobacterium sp.]
MNIEEYNRSLMMESITLLLIIPLLEIIRYDSVGRTAEILAYAMYFGMAMVLIDVITVMLNFRVMARNCRKRNTD